MAKIDFAFGGWIRGADVTKVTVVDTGADLNVEEVSADELMTKLATGEWAISLGDYLYDSEDAEIEISDFEESGA
jgi:hypothetical protein